MPQLRMSKDALHCVRACDEKRREASSSPYAAQQTSSKEHKEPSAPVASFQRCKKQSMQHRCARTGTGKLREAQGMKEHGLKSSLEKQRLLREALKVYAWDTEAR